MSDDLTNATNSTVVNVLSVLNVLNISATFLAACKAYGFRFTFTNRITKQDSRGDSADGWLDLGLDV
ncbi:hypothetical protein TNCV_1152111 [Trichonephila clavipes]|nr:hypothetical protein TNCV_1152111 [Trichonephila clavipes]